MHDQPFKPSQFVGELRSGLRVAVGQVNATDENTTNRSFHISGPMIVIIARKHGACEDGRPIAGEDCHTIPRALTDAYRFISGRPKSVDWKGALLRFEFLQTDDVGFLPCEPIQEVSKP